MFVKDDKLLCYTNFSVIQTYVSHGFLRVMKPRLHLKAG